MLAGVAAFGTLWIIQEAGISAQKEASPNEDRYFVELIELRRARKPSSPRIFEQLVKRESLAAEGSRGSRGSRGSEKSVVTRSLSCFGETDSKDVISRLRGKR